MFYTVPTSEESAYQHIAVPFTGKTFAGFKQALAFKESQGKYHKVNPFGYMGKYQFGAGTLRTIGITNFDLFLKNPAMQEKAFNALVGQIMKASQGKANPSQVNELLRKKLS